MSDIDLRKKNDFENEEDKGEEITIDNRKNPKPKDKRTTKEKLRDFFANPKKRIISITVLGIILIALVGIGLRSMTRDSSSNSTQNEKKENKQAPSTALTPSPLTGVPVSSDAASRHPLAVVVENHPDARPQAGLTKADIVYEAIAEGGITRFMAIFGSQEATKVGPVRSARTFFVDWARGYNAYLAHVGGNIDALDQIKAEKVLDLDQFSYSGPYWRERVANLATEHTMYTDTTKLREQAAKNNYTTANNFNVLKFKDDPTDKTTLPESQKITVDFSSNDYKVAFQYDKATNSYKRFLAGVPHTDQVDKNQINPKNVIVMTVDRKAVVTRINEQGYTMTTVGTGKAKIFIDGKTIDGTWKKASKTDRELFYDESGNEVTFNRGQFWISVVPPESKVTVE